MFIIKFRSEEELPEGYFKHVKLFCETLCATTLNNLKDPLSKKSAPPRCSRWYSETPLSILLGNRVKEFSQRILFKSQV